MPRTAIETSMIDFSLGASEMPQRLPDLWSRTGRVRLPESLMHSEDDDARLEPGSPFSARNQRALSSLHGRLLEQCSFPSVLVDRHSEIVHISARAGRFLQFAGGEPSHNVLAAIRPELRSALRRTIRLARKVPHRIDAPPIGCSHEGRTLAVRIIARTIHDDETNEDFVLVLFDESPVATNDALREQTQDVPASTIAQLEGELEGMKSKLRQKVEEYETSNEELRTVNKELLASYSQLRSAAVVLEVNKEDLEAANSELRTVNTELRARVRLTTKINDDLQNLIAANDIGTLFVDRKLRIMRFTPRAKDIFDVLDSDIGRSLLEVPHRLQYDHLEVDAEQALDSLRLVEREVRSNDGRWFSARFQPYRATGNLIEGAVLSFVDITSRRMAEERLHSASQTALQEVERRQDDFLAAVSHELKHPLNLIGANAELIARSSAARCDPGLARAAQTITRTVTGQAQIIDDLLDSSRLRTRKYSIERTFGDAASESSGSPPPTFLRDTAVVLVDDDQETVEAFKLLLETEGANVMVATAGEEALRILDRRCPAFILSDIGMPGMTGFQLIEAVRQRNALAGVKAIALSGFGRDSDVQEALRAGFDAYLTKPVTFDALLSTMARLRAR